VHLAWGSDVGAGNRFSLLGALDEGYKIGMLNNATLKDEAEAERNKISPYRGFWSITLGGAQALYIDECVGNFDPGKEADFVALDWKAGPAALAWRQSLVGGGQPRTVEQAADLLFGIMMVSDDRAVAETWVMGKRLYKKAE
jgi:guanine deaminase